MDTVKFKIQKKDSNKTVKQFLKDCYLGRGKIEEIRVKKTCFINGINKNIESILQENDILEFQIDEQVDFIPDIRPIEILYEDDYLLIINKPKGILVHPDEKYKNGTLCNRVAYYYQKNHIQRKVRYLHRLDKDTTGIIIFAKDAFTEAKGCHAMELHQIERNYLAIVTNPFEKKDGKITLRIGRDRHDSKKYRVSSTGIEACTIYHYMKALRNNYYLVKCSLRTGRTHQIRVHMSALNHPLAGDKLYGGDCSFIDRVALHSYQLTMQHPFENKTIRLECKMPKDFLVFLQ